jgi:hypothetical protein
MSISWLLSNVLSKVAISIAEAQPRNQIQQQIGHLAKSSAPKFDSLWLACQGNAGSA